MSSTASGPQTPFVGLNPSNNYVPLSIDAGGNLKVAVSGAGSGGTSSVDKSNFTAGASAGTAIMGAVNPSDTPANGTIAIAALDSARNVKVNIVAGAAGNPAAGNTGSAVPAQADYAGINVGGTLRGAVGFDLDTGVGTEFDIGVNLRQSANGGSVELGTLAVPMRTDPTGTTTQPVSIASGNSNITSGNVTANLQLGTPTTANWTSATANNTAVTISTANLAAVAISAAVTAGAVSGGTLNFEASIDGSNYYPIGAYRTSSQGVDVTFALSGLAPSLAWQAPIAGFNSVRVRLNPTVTGNGTVYMAIVGTAATAHVDAVTVTSGTVNIGSGNSNVAVTSGNLNATITGTPAVTITSGNSNVNATQAGSWFVGASSASNAAVPANAHYVAGLIETTAFPTAGGAGNLAGVLVDKVGRQIVAPQAPRQLVKTASLSSNNNAATTLIAAGGAGNFCDICFLTITNENTATATVVTLNDNGGANGTSYKFAIAAGGGAVMAPPVPLPQGANSNTAWTVLNSNGVALDYVAIYVINQ